MNALDLLRALRVALPAGAVPSLLLGEDGATLLVSVAARSQAGSVYEWSFSGATAVQPDGDPAEAAQRVAAEYRLAAGIAVRAALQSG